MKIDGASTSEKVFCARALMWCQLGCGDRNHVLSFSHRKQHKQERPVWSCNNNAALKYNALKKLLPLLRNITDLATASAPLEGRTDGRMDGGVFHHLLCGASNAHISEMLLPIPSGLARLLRLGPYLNNCRHFVEHLKGTQPLICCTQSCGCSVCAQRW